MKNRWTRSTQKWLKDWLFISCSIITLLLAGYFLFEFFSKAGAHATLPAPLPTCYIVTLIAYIMEKEMERWLDKKSEKRKGELFVFLWIALFITMYSTQFITGGTYKVPHELETTTVYVLCGFVATHISKCMHGKSKTKKHSVVHHCIHHR